MLILSILQAIADPQARKPFEFSSCTINVLQFGCNKSHEKILQSMCAEIEVIQGLPGKSSTIFHIISSLVSPEEAALILCVQNQVVDSVAEKLAYGKIQFVVPVYGCEKNLEPGAALFTIDSQDVADPRVVRQLQLQLQKNTWNTVQLARLTQSSKPVVVELAKVESQCCHFKCLNLNPELMLS
jgi:hypothetical protein